MKTFTCHRPIIALAAATLCLAGIAWADSMDTGTQQERFGLFSTTEFRVTTGRCEDCRTPKPVLWYFEDEWIAVPTTDADPPPFLVWAGSPDLINDARLDGNGVRLSRSSVDEPISLSLVPQLSTNRSFYNEATAHFFADRPLRLRGRLSDHGTRFEARTIWPADFLLTPESAQVTPTTPATVHQLIEDPHALARPTLAAYVLWAREGTGMSWAGKPVLGLMLNGAQGDDDEAHGGHFGLFTGRVGSQGEWADWLMNNFYDPDVVSEKGIIPAMVPMDNYLYDLNSGQSYYRPSYMVVLVLKDDRIPLAYQRSMQEQFMRLYRHELDYDHTRSNCAGLSIDALRNLGWQIPMQGPSGRVKAGGAFAYLTAVDRSVTSGQKIYRYFMEEQTRLLPRVTFEAIATDALVLITRNHTCAQGQKTDFETRLTEDLEAILFVTIPQTPSNRAAGTYPVASLDEYQARVPKDRSQWKTVQVPPRPFPQEWRPSSPELGFTSSWQPPLAVATALTVLVGVVVVRRRRATQNR